MLNLPYAALCLSAALVPVLCGTARAQALPAPSPTPSGSASAAPAGPGPLGPTFGANDPCTTIGAIVTRPTVSNSVCTVRPNRLLVETGYQNISFGQGAGVSVFYPQPLLRMGTPIPALELDLIMPGIERTTTGGPLLTGATDAGFGLKYVLGASPKMSYGAQASVTIPSGTNGISAGGSTQYYALNGTYSFSPAVSLGSTIALNGLSNGSTHWNSVIPSLVLSATLPGATSVYAEGAAYTNALGPVTSTRIQYITGVSRDRHERASRSRNGFLADQGDDSVPVHRVRIRTLPVVPRFDIG